MTPPRQRRIVLTGGPGAGKTAVLELVRHYFHKHVDLLPEAASILFRGGFRRGLSPQGRAATQHAIFHVQRQLEAVAEIEPGMPVCVCDRGTVDGLAYWPGPADFWSTLGTTREQEYARYATVIHLRTPSSAGGYDHSNPFRLESAAEAARIDGLIAQAWDAHPHRFTIESTDDFLVKANRALAIVRSELGLPE